MSTQALQRPRLILLLARFSHPYKDLAAATLSWMCKATGTLFDVYYAVNRNDGGIFSPHGSLVLGGRHHSAIARALARFSTTVVKLDDVSLFDTLVRTGAERVIAAPESLVELYEQMAELLHLSLPPEVVAFQTQDLPAGLTHGMAELVPTREGHRLAEREGEMRKPAVVQYAFPEAVYRKALAVPLEMPAAECAQLRRIGVTTVWTVAGEQADRGAWLGAGMAVKTAETLAEDDDFGAMSARVARRWLAQATGVDMHEPLLASSWLPFSVRENRLQISAPAMVDAAAALVPLVEATKQTFFYGRYGGGATRGAVSDEDIFELFKRAVSFEVVEPGRPLLTVFSHEPQPLPQPAGGPFSVEPSDDELRAWAEQGKIPVTLVFHSGEMSHDDGNTNIMDLSAALRVCVGLGTHFQRYYFDPECVEPMHTPQSEGGVLGLCEPVLHSTGLGILAESMCSPQTVARLMQDGRERIARLAGERFAPRGVYCYLDAFPWRWDEPNHALWTAIRDAGFEYVISSVGAGTSRVLYRDGDFVVLSQTGGVHYPFSPFMRVDTVADIISEERRLLNRRRAGWIMAVLDTPIYAYSSYLAVGDPFKSRGGLGQFHKYIAGGGETGKLVSATPHTIARFARLTSDG